MRFLMVLSILFCFSLEVYAQQYIPLLGDSKKWHLGYYDAENCPDPEAPLFWCETFVLEDLWSEDLNGIAYDYYGDLPMYNTPLFLREDALEQEVYFYDTNNEEEFLLYDFSAVSGDTLELADMIQSYEVVISQVDTVMLSDGLPRRRYFQEGESEPFWIEGIGNVLNGLPYNTIGLGFGGTLLCYVENDEELMGEYCELVGLSESDESKTALFPNPMTTSAILDLGEMNGPITLEIYDLSGKLVRLEGLLPADGHHIIHRYDLEAGMYLLKLKIEDVEEVKNLLIK